MKLPDTRGYYGPYGGKFVPEVLMEPISELESAYEQARKDADFQREFDRLCKHWVGRPTPLYEARQLSNKVGGGTVLLKREDLAHTGAHKINNALGQALLAQLKQNWLQSFLLGLERKYDLVGAKNGLDILTGQIASQEGIGESVGDESAPAQRPA